MSKLVKFASSGNIRVFYIRPVTRGCQPGLTSEGRGHRAESIVYRLQSVLFGGQDEAIF